MRVRAYASWRLQVVVLSSQVNILWFATSSLRLVFVMSLCFASSVTYDDWGFQYSSKAAQKMPFCSFSGNSSEKKHFHNLRSVHRSWQHTTRCRPKIWTVTIAVALRVSHPITASNLHHHLHHDTTTMVILVNGVPHPSYHTTSPYPTYKSLTNITTHPPSPPPQ